MPPPPTPRHTRWVNRATAVAATSAEPEEAAAPDSFGAPATAGGGPVPRQGSPANLADLAALCDQVREESAAGLSTRHNHQQHVTEKQRAMEKHQKRKRHVCRTCGASVFNLAPHTKTCKGTLLKNKASQLAGLKKGTAKATRSTRARSRVTTLPRLWRVDDAGALATLSATQLKTQPLSVRGWADPPVITTTPPATSQVAALETLQRLIPIGQRPVVKVYTSLPGKYEVESPDWTDLPGTKRVNIHAPDFVLPLHAYGYVMVDDCETGRACAEECAPVPDVLRKDLLPSKYAVVFSTGGVVLTSHHDSCGGLLVLAEGSSAIGQIIFGEQYAHERGVDVFGATREDEEGCHWRDVAELLLPGDLVTIPHKHPHAVRWGGIRVCVAYFDIS
jgi:hypothetical protein